MQALLSHRPVSLTAFDNAALRAAVDNILARHAIDTIFVFSSQMAQYLPARAAPARDHGFRRHGFGQVRRLRAERQGPDGLDAAAARRGCCSQHETRGRGARRCQPVRQRGRGRSCSASAPAPSASMSSRTASTPNSSIPPRRSSGSTRWAALIVFTGQMDYRPNIEAVTWFVETILPHIRAGASRRALRDRRAQPDRCGQGAGQAAGRDRDRRSRRRARLAGGGVGGRRAAQAGARHPEQGARRRWRWRGRWSRPTPRRRASIMAARSASATTVGEIAEQVTQLLADPAQGGRRWAQAARAAGDGAL